MWTGEGVRICCTLAGSIWVAEGMWDPSRLTREVAPRLY